MVPLQVEHLKQEEGSESKQSSATSVPALAGCAPETGGGQ